MTVSISTEKPAPWRRLSKLHFHKFFSDTFDTFDTRALKEPHKPVHLLKIHKNCVSTAFDSSTVIQELKETSML